MKIKLIRVSVCFLLIAGCLTNCQKDLKVDISDEGEVKFNFKPVVGAYLPCQPNRRGSYSRFKKELRKKRI